MDHDRAMDLFTPYHDGELAAPEQAELEQHLAECEGCRREWEDYRRTVGELSGLHLLRPSADFARNVEQKIRRRSRGRFFGEQRSLGTQFAVVSFILILLFILAYLVLTTVNEIVIVEDGADGGTPATPAGRGAAAE